MSTLVLAGLRVLVQPSVPLMLLLVVLTTLLLVRMHRHFLEVADTFPELGRVPILRTVLAVQPS
jgi:hypothetical protein